MTDEEPSGARACAPVTCACRRTRRARCSTSSGARTSIAPSRSSSSASATPPSSSASCSSSAVANADNNHDLHDADELYVSACYADEGPTLKRWRPRARGRATRIRKRTCHITVIVSRLPEAELETSAGAVRPLPPSAARRRPRSRGWSAQRPMRTPRPSRRSGRPTRARRGGRRSGDSKTTADRRRRRGRDGARST